MRARDFEIRSDEPVKSGGDDTGPQPTELFLASLAACFTLSLAHVARKRKIALADLSVRVVGTYAGAKFASIRIEVTCDHPREELEMLSQRASAICYVSNTIRALSDTEVVIN